MAWHRIARVLYAKWRRNRREQQLVDALARAARDALAKNYPISYSPEGRGFRVEWKGSSLWGAVPTLEEAEKALDRSFPGAREMVGLSKALHALNEFWAEQKPAPRLPSEDVDNNRRWRDCFGDDE
jgi:hypothetical protein